ncbi:helix-turn-helix domain-containing protein [Psychrobacter sp. APC 3350]|uniref:helix-turn-helix domain-containing protein n=1 Tax=Psychrobacter sp. APC 3350 TaxID=3035195 RepID=UPI0025B3213F|nr:helix-turn-helix domain-containing protein [Psychrobacter sp. APC 3350]MDN3453481.1 helix-turn-helix domain-containing protein [Psychrobacter sp. APC 3350]
MTTTATAPVIPSQAPKTQIDTVRAHLMTGATITTWDAYRLYQITCLAQRVHDLRSAGLVIQSEIVTHNDKRFSVYWLDEATLLDSEVADHE